MAGFIKNIIKFSMLAIMLPGVVFGVQQPNLRGAANSHNEERSSDEAMGASVRRSATSVVARSADQNKRQSRAVVGARSSTMRGISGRSGTDGGAVVRSATKARAGNNVKTGETNSSRVGVARATAVFNDVSKIGGGYSSCRDAYATCMDQLCANANDTYRRCYCSDRFRDFRDTSDKIDEAVKMLAEFQDVNLDAVNKTAAEVNAMYSATAGEEAIKRDTSASQKLLDNISQLLSGKKSTSYKSSNSGLSTLSLGVLDFSAFSSGLDDVFGSNSSSVFDTSSIFGKSSSSYTDVSSLEGADLYNAAMQQCVQITQDSCSSDTIFNLARSAYSLLVTQDCNVYEKGINSKKANLQETIRTAEKYLREARLAEYRAHNSEDVSECLSRVESAMHQSNVCGENYEKCLDYSGLYINSSTGEPIYSQALFGLNSLIVLDGSADVVSANPKFDSFLEEKKVFVAGALDTCRSIADTVWEEFKRQAIIEIAQAQDEKIEEIKASCVTTMKECYDTQTGALNDLASEVAKSATTAISVVAARDMCKDKVFACAALYGDVGGCSYDDKTKKISAVNGKKCGLQSLLAMVDAIDSVKFAKGCEESLREYVEETCAPASSDSKHSYPWGCRKISPEALEEMLVKRASISCANDFESDYSISNKNRFNPNYSAVISEIIRDIREDMADMLRDECLGIETEGYHIWDTSGYSVPAGGTVNVSPRWLETVYGGSGLKSLIEVGVSGYNLMVERYGTSENISGETKFGWGVCMIPTVEQWCGAQNQVPGMEGMAKYVNGRCELDSTWYKEKCAVLGGYFSGDTCFIR